MTMQHMLAPAAIAAGLFFALPSHAHGDIQVGIGLPPFVIDANGVTVVVGQPPPPPPVVREVRYVEPAPQQVIVVHNDGHRCGYREVHYVNHHEHNDYRRPVVVVHDRDDHRHYKYKKAKHHGHGHGKGHGHGHSKHAYFR